MASIGVEPIRPYGQWILNPSRLPIPPRGLCGAFALGNTADLCSITDDSLMFKPVRFVAASFQSFKMSSMLTPKTFLNFDR